MATRGVFCFWGAGVIEAANRAHEQKGIDQSELKVYQKECHHFFSQDWVVIKNTDKTVRKAKKKVLSLLPKVFHPSFCALGSNIPLQHFPEQDFENFADEADDGRRLDLACCRNQFSYTHLHYHSRVEHSQRETEEDRVIQEDEKEERERE